MYNAGDPEGTKNEMQEKNRTETARETVNVNQQIPTNQSWSYWAGDHLFNAGTAIVDHSRRFTFAGLTLQAVGTWFKTSNPNRPPG